MRRFRQEKSFRHSEESKKILGKEEKRDKKKRGGGTEWQKGKRKSKQEIRDN